MKKSSLLELLLVLLVTLVPLLYDAGASYVQPTADLWIERSVGFASAFGRGDFAATYQQYHPGVTVMWLVGAGSWLFYRSADPAFGSPPDVLSPEVFYAYAPYAKVPLMLGLGVLMIALYLVLKKIAGRRVALLSTLLLSFEPFYVASARSIHLDAMLTMTMMLAALLLYVSLSHPFKSRWSLLTGILIGLAFLSKIVTIYLVPFVGLTLLLAPFSWKERVQRFAGLMGVAFLTFVVLFPAVWAAPIDTLWTKIIAEGIIDTGVGETSRSLLVGLSEGFWYHAIAYPVTALYRFSPLFTVGLLGWLASLGHLVYSRKQGEYNPRSYKRLGAGDESPRGSEHARLWVHLALFTFFYLLMMSLSTKKIYRYVLPIFPPLAIFAAYGWEWVLRQLEPWGVRLRLCVFDVAVALLLLIQLQQFSTHSPHFFAYFNPLLGGIEGASQVVALNQDATGYEEVATYLNAKEDAEDISVSSYDWKILGMLFVGDTVSAKRAEKPLTSDYLLLPIQRGHEWVTDEYELERTFEVGGVDYWFLYKRHEKNEVSFMGPEPRSSDVSPIESTTAPMKRVLKEYSVEDICTALDGSSTRVTPAGFSFSFCVPPHLLGYHPVEGLEHVWSLNRDDYVITSHLALIGLARRPSEINPEERDAYDRYFEERLVMFLSYHQVAGESLEEKIRTYYAGAASISPSLRSPGDIVASNLEPGPLGSLVYTGYGGGETPSKRAFFLHQEQLVIAYLDGGPGTGISFTEHAESVFDVVIASISLD